jgi:excisionase family DNA binding protein
MLKEKYLTRNEVSEHLRVTTRTVDNYIREGRLKAIKIKSLVRIEEKSLGRLIRANPINAHMYLQ